MKEMRFQKEYFQLPYRSSYKVCNRYRIASKTLEDFGLEIDQRMREHPLVWSNDNMSITAPCENKEEADNKPFCCTHCGNENYTKYGKKNGKQVYKCKDCNRKFVDNMFFERRKADPKIICLTLDLYFKGVSLRKISDHLKQFHNIDVYFTTIFRWIDRYIRIMDEYVRQFKPQTSEIWNVDEMMISVNGDWFYLWNVIDDETRFHLASVISKHRRVDDASKALRTAKKRSHGGRPSFIITDGLKSYVKAVDDEFHTVKRDIIHVGNVGIRGKHFDKNNFDNNLVERLHGTIRERNKTQRGLKDEYSAFIRGHQVYYNFIRPHMSLYNNTPAEFAGVDLNLGNNKWENLLMQSLKYRKGEKNER
jgi:transposase-like protein